MECGGLPPLSYGEARLAGERPARVAFSCRRLCIRLPRNSQFGTHDCRRPPLRPQNSYRVPLLSAFPRATLHKGNSPMAGVNRSARGKFHTPNPSEPGVLTRHPGWNPSPNPFTFSITTSSRPCFSTRYALENRIPRNPLKTIDGDAFYPVQKATPLGVPFELHFTNFRSSSRPVFRRADPADRPTPSAPPLYPPPHGAKMWPSIHRPSATRGGAIQ